MLWLLLTEKSADLKTENDEPINLRTSANQHKAASRWNASFSYMTRELRTEHPVAWHRNKLQKSNKRHKSDR